ncbi:M48 family metalloprotease [Larkinella sp. VNQ87]|uniref:M48 family metalloprotease n=1 Tax=Larkinella sp. VNQ87 TaxID=3400921 RepID=UPI003C09BA0B
MHMNRTFTRLLLWSALLSFSACSRNPVTGKRELSLMSTEQEIAIGKESHPSVVTSMGLYEDKRLNEFINEKGKAMARISHRPDLPYQFYIVDSPVVNAFAVPGGYVYFTRGIMAHFNNEAEFAGVLGHEIGHITARHSARQQTSQLLGTLGMIGGAILVPQLGQNIEALQQGLGLFLLKYSRDHESESDKIGVEYSSKIGYDAKQMANFFGTIKRISDNAGQVVPTFMSTHPDPGDRNAKVKQMATAYQQQNQGNFKVERERYLRMIDGLLYGEDPRQGFVENDVFYHPELRFQFPVPKGWQHQNSPSQFQMAPKDGKSAMILMLAKGKSLDEAAQTLVQQLSLNVLENAKTTINGNPAYVLISQQKQQQQQGQPQQQQDPRSTLQIGTWLIQYNNAIYALHGLSAASDFQAAFRTFKPVAESFRALTDSEKINRKADRVLVREVPRAGTFREVMGSLGMPASRLEELGVLNSLRPDDKLEKGSLIKIIGK